MIIGNHFPSFKDKDGTPLNNGLVFFGTANANAETSPITVYWDDALTQPVAQPVKTLNGYLVREGQIANVYCATNYSVTVKNKQLELLYALPDSSKFDPNFFLNQPSGSSILGFSQSYSYLPGTVGSKLKERLSVKDAPYSAKGDGTTDDTAAIQACIDDAQALGKVVYLPSGTYVVTGLLYGAQNIIGQSQAPLGFIGEGWTSILKAKAGFTGTILQAWSIAGTHFESFQIDGNSSAATCIDTSWKAGHGPSCQNRYCNIRCFGATDTVWNAYDNNDCIFDQCIVTGAGHSKIGFNAVASGGLLWLRDCVWNNCYLKFGAQNGSIQNSWGHGIMFAQGCLNYINIHANYIYGNTSLNAVLKSESYSSFQSVHSLFASATQFIADNTIAAFFDLNAYSTLDFHSCQWVKNCPTMFGANCRNDSFAKVKTLFRGGSIPSTLNINTPSNFIVETDGLMNDGTGYNVPNKKTSIYANSGNSATFGSNTYYDLIAENTLEEGVYLISFSWNHNSAGNPWIVRGCALVPIVSATTGSGNGVDIPVTISEHNLTLGTTMNFRLVNTGSGGTPKVQWKCSAALNSPGAYTWTATKLTI